jgi:cytochrome c-type biogenesis protein CcmE
MENQCFHRPVDSVNSPESMAMAAITTGKKLAIAGLIVGVASAYMAYLGASSSWQYYVTVKECVENASQVGGQRLRVSGSIVPGSLVISPDRQEARFALCEEGSNISVVCTGPLPDDLSPEKTAEVVVEGRVGASCTLGHQVVLVGDKLITKCASKYSSRKKEAITDLRSEGIVR